MWYIRFPLPAAMLPLMRQLLLPSEPPLPLLPLLLPPPLAPPLPPSAVAAAGGGVGGTKAAAAAPAAAVPLPRSMRHCCGTSKEPAHMPLQAARASSSSATYALLYCLRGEAAAASSKSLLQPCKLCSRTKHHLPAPSSRCRTYMQPPSLAAPSRRSNPPGLLLQTERRRRGGAVRSIHRRHARICLVPSAWRNL